MKDNITFKHLVWEDIDNYCLSMYNDMTTSGYRPDCIVGLLRGGIVPARIFSDYFNVLIDFFALDVKLYNGVGKTKAKPIIRELECLRVIRGKKILIVDDIWDSGRTMNAVLYYLKGEDIKTATIVWKETAKKKPDFHAFVAYEKEWIVFPWEKNEFKREIKE